MLDQKLSFSPKFFVASVAIYFVYWVVACAIWQRLLLWLLGVRVSLGESFSQLTLVSVGKYVPGKVWGMIARGGHLQRHAVDWRGSTLATVVEQAALMQAAATHSLVIAGLVDETWRRPFWIMSAAALLVVGVVVYRPCVRAAMKLMSRARDDANRELITALDAPKYLVLVSGFFLLWTLIGSVFASLYFTFYNAQFEWKLWLALLLSNTVGVTAGFLALFAPGGIGVREAVGSAILSGYMPTAQAIAVCVLFRLWTVVAELVSGIVAISLAALKQRHRHEK